jgi:hypothetical protein
MLAIAHHDRVLQAGRARIQPPQILQQIGYCCTFRQVNGQTRDTYAEIQARANA